MKKTIVSLLVVLSVSAFTATQKPKWVSLFNGKDFTGWTVRGEQVKNDYRIENREIVGTSKPGSQNTFLCTEKEYTDFILELEVKADTGMNSGIQFRSRSLPEYKNGRVHGYQAEIDPSARAWSGGLYDEARRDWLVNLKNNPEGQKAYKESLTGTSTALKRRAGRCGFSQRRKNHRLHRHPPDQWIHCPAGTHGTKKERPMEVRWRNIRLAELPGK